MLDIICYKLDPEHLTKMDVLIFDKKIYFSRSEIIRIAARHLLRKLKEQSYGFPLPPMPLPDSTELEEGFPKKNKESVSSKFPVRQLKQIDELVKHHDFFPTRSYFLRESLNELFHDYAELYERIN